MSSMKKKIKDYTQQAKIARGILDKKVYTGPWSVQIDLTNKCNNNCIACWCHSPLLGDKAMKPEIKKQFLSYKKVISLIDELDELGVRDIYFTGGGEPFMHSRILEIMKHVKSKKIHLDMSTNFTLVRKKTAKKLVEIGIDHMNLSLWSGSPETYAKQHPNKNEKTFLKMGEMIDYINTLKEQKGTDKPRLGMYNVITVHNYFEVDKMLEFAFKHRMNDIDFTPVDTVPGRTDDLKLKKKHRKILADKIRKMPEQMELLRNKYNRDLGFKNYHSFLRRIENQDAEDANYDSDILDKLPSCYAGWTFARVLATGEVNSCLKSFKIPIGNINEKSFKEIWFGDKQKEFRKHTIDYDKENPYFCKMGNDIATDGQGCYKCCDNLGFNLLVHDKLNKLGPVEKQLLRVSRLL